MADFKRTPQGANSYVYPEYVHPEQGYAGHRHPEYVVTPVRNLGRATNLVGALMSLALVAGVGVWGYKLLVRDVNGIPIVRAAAGEMRVRPDIPGGQMADHQGLSVNSVAAIGTADAPADELRLAPQPTELEDEDQPMAQIEEAFLSDEEELPAELVVNAEMEVDSIDVAGALETGSIDDLVAELTSGVIAMDQTGSESVPVLASASIDEVPAVLSGAGLSVSLRPSLRPASAARPQGAATPVAASASSAAEVNAASVPAGTRLVQLGAFDTPEIARAQWDALNSRFAPFIQGKSRIVMEAKSGGRTFYRLRAQGFEDIGDARRFCSALVAESVDCIPVVSR